MLGVFDIRWLLKTLLENQAIEVGEIIFNVKLHR